MYNYNILSKQFRIKFKHKRDNESILFINELNTRCYIPHCK